MHTSPDSELALFGLGEDLSELERRVEGCQGAVRLTPLVALAWCLRQRDCARALLLADEADALLRRVDLAPAQRRNHVARLLLLRAEVKLLFAEIEEADRLMQAAARTFAELDDALGIADAHWTSASIALDRGDFVQTNDMLQLAGLHYGRLGDSTRQQASLARYLAYDAFRDTVGTAQALHAAFAAGVEWPNAVLAWLAAAHGNVAGLTDDPATAIRQFLQGYHAALASGQIRQALVSITNAVEAFAKLGDLDAALQWSEKALQLAHRTGWPASLGLTLMQAGNVMRLLSRPQEARKYLQDALAVMSSLKGSRTYELVLGSLGELELDAGDASAALVNFSELESRVKSHMEPDQVITAWRGQASALCQLNRVEEAHAKATAALALAREVGSAEPQVHVLRVFAQIHQNHALPAPAGMTAPTAALHYLQNALAVAASMHGFTPSADLLSQLASAYADCGDYKAAYAASRQAAAAREKVHAEQTQRRALAVHIHSQVQRAQAQAEHHKQLANSLRETAATLEVLGTIGRAVTASLDAQAVFEALHRHVHELLDASSFAVYLLDDEHAQLTTAFAREGGVDLPVRSIPMGSPTSRFARCARERKDLVFHLDPDEMDGLIPGTLATRSLLYSPLMIGERLLGVMTIQSSAYNAYGERERSIFQSLCAYGAIALDNSAAYAIAAASQHRADQALHDLRETQKRLVEQNQELERLAVTDQLTGLNNRLRLDQALREERQRHARHGTGFAVLMVDVDHFKSVNDSYGHPVGDQVLVGIARILLHNSRELDVVGRWGGEEFLVICRETSVQGAMALAEKLRNAVQTHVFEGVGQKSISIGAAVFRPTESLTETLARADAALYRAKLGGRNRAESGESPNPAGGVT